MTAVKGGPRGADLRGMPLSVLSLEPDATALDPRLTLHAATVGVGVTGGLWRLINVVGLPLADAAPTFALGVLLGLLQLAWAARLAVRPGRGWLLLGAGATAVSLVASVAVLVAEPVGRAGVVPAVVGVTLQLTLLGLALAGVCRVTPVALMRHATCVGLVVVGMTMSVLVAGGAQDHVHAAPRPSAGDPFAAPAPAAAPRSLLCHLV